MISAFAGGDKISERLQESLARLRKDIDRVELWAGALEGFSHPIPEYDGAQRYSLAPQKGDSQEIDKVNGKVENSALRRAD